MDWTPQLDLTQVVVVGMGYAAGLIHQWLRLRRDAEAGRSLRPPKLSPREARRLAKQLETQAARMEWESDFNEPPTSPSSKLSKPRPPDSDR